MKKAVGEAVRELAAQQKAAADFFEAFEAYTPTERKAALGRARAFQTKTGLGFGASKQLLEVYKRTYGQIEPAATEQLAGYWQLHGQEATGDLVRWMGASGVEGAGRQGQILRMISATATHAKIHDPELIRATLRYSEEFRAMGWGPEQTITNVGKIVAGTTGRESTRAIAGLVEGLKTFTEEKALEAGAPAGIAATQQGRLGWVRQQIAGMPLEQRNKFMREQFGQTYATWVTKFLTGEMPAGERAALEYARTPAAAAEERERVFGYRETAEGLIERGKGARGVLGLDIKTDEKLEAEIREHGAGYLKWLKRRDRLKYELITLKTFGTETEKEVAASYLWESGLTPEEREEYIGTGLGRKGAGAAFRDLSPRERLEGIGRALEIHYHNEQISNYLPRVGEIEYTRIPP